MKSIEMTTKTNETVKMGAYSFKTGISVDVEDKAADALLKRPYPKFKETTPPAGKKVK